VTADTIWTHGGYDVTGATAPTFTRPPMTYAASSSTYMPVDPYAGNLPTIPTLPTQSARTTATRPVRPVCLRTSRIRLLRCRRGHLRLPIRATTPLCHSTTAMATMANMTVLVLTPWF